MVKRCLHWICVVGGVAAAALGCASRGNIPPASESTPSAGLARQRQEADTFKAQARQGLIHGQLTVGKQFDHNGAQQRIVGRPQFERRNYPQPRGKIGQLDGP